jgi:hypothetical protein
MLALDIGSVHGEFALTSFWIVATKRQSIAFCWYPSISVIVGIRHKQMQDMASHIRINRDETSNGAHTVHCQQSCL